MSQPHQAVYAGASGPNLESKPSVSLTEILAVAAEAEPKMTIILKELVALQ